MKLIYNFVYLGPAERTVMAKEILELLDIDDDGYVTRDEFIVAAKAGKMNDYFFPVEPVVQVQRTSSLKRAIQGSKKVKWPFSKRKTKICYKFSLR